MVTARKQITTRFSAPEHCEGEERSDESTPLLGTNQIQLHYYVSSNHSCGYEISRQIKSVRGSDSAPARNTIPGGAQCSSPSRRSAMTFHFP